MDDLSDKNDHPNQKFDENGEKFPIDENDNPKNKEDGPYEKQHDNIIDSVAVNCISERECEYL